MLFRSRLQNHRVRKIDLVEHFGRRLTLGIKHRLGKGKRVRIGHAMLLAQLVEDLLLLALLEHEFEGQKKAYEIVDRAELEQVIRDSYASGYTDDLILQDRVPGNDEYMRVLKSKNLNEPSRSSYLTSKME